MYLIFAPPDDLHALAVATALRQSGAVVQHLWTAEFPLEWSIDWKISNDISLLTFNSDKDAWGALDIKGAWLRRLPRPRVHSSIHDENVARFTSQELDAAMRGVLGNLTSNIINEPKSEVRASDKLHQLVAARKVGLQIPETLVSTDQEKIISFKQSAPENIIFKSFTGTSFQFTETRRLTDDLMRLLPSVAVAPTIFQHEIRARSHLRVTVIDDEIFAARITVSDSERFLDWRLDPTPRITREKIDSLLESQVIALMEELSLRYGAMDFVVGDEGEVFLEVNPGGQFLFIEIHADLPISAAIASALVRGR